MNVIIDILGFLHQTAGLTAIGAVSHRSQETVQESEEASMERVSRASGFSPVYSGLVIE